jgi:hypothetical protein
MKRYFECQSCGTIHYGVSQEEADQIKGHLFGEFNERNLKCCSGCGRSYPFIEVNDAYANLYLQGGKVQPWLVPMDADGQTTTSTIN